MADNDKVTNCSPEYDAMANAGCWDLITSLMGGTMAMREKRETFLPRNTSESITNYNARVKRSFLFNGLKDTIHKTSAKPFGKPVKVMPDTLPEEIDVIINDVDGTHLELTQFANNCMRSAETYGLTHILTDNSTLGDERRSDLVNPQTVIVNITAPNLFYWETDANNELSEIRFYEHLTEKVGEWSQKSILQIKVYRKDEILLFRRPGEKDGADFELYDEPLKNELGEIPLVTYYTGRDGFMTAIPPFLELAMMNLAHWQSYSDQRNILHFARVPFLFGAGFPKKKGEQGITIGSQEATLVESPDAKLGYIEPTGKGIESGRQDLQDLEDRMTILGMQPLLESSINTTATAQGIHESKSQSELQSWIRGLEKALEDAYRLAGKWRNKPLSDDFKIDIYSDFVPGIGDMTRQQNLNQAYVIGAIDRMTWLNESARGGFIAPDSDLEQINASADTTVSMNTDLSQIGEEE